jgi:opacity protein-like surface antigen
VSLGLRDNFLAGLLFIAVSPAMAQSPTSEEANPQPNRFALTFKTGGLKLVDDSQALSGSSLDWNFERTASNVLAIEGETRLPKELRNFSLGGEFIYYTNHYKAASGMFPEEGKIYSRALLVKSKYYFRPGEPVQPYAGAGFGLALSDDFDHGPIRGTASGYGYLGVLGVQLRAERIGLRVEYVALRAHPMDDEGHKLDASTRGVLVGLSFFLGRR